MNLTLLTLLQINRAEYVEPSKFYSNPNVYKGKVGNVTQAAQVAMRQNKGAAYPAGLQYTYNAPSFPFSGRFGDVSWHEGIGHMVGDNNPQILRPVLVLITEWIMNPLHH